MKKKDALPLPSEVVRGKDVEALLAETTSRLKEISPNGHRVDYFDDEALMENLHLANSYYDKNLPGAVESKRAVFGHIIRFVKRMILRLTGWYVNPALDSQRFYNAYVARSLNEIKRYLDHLQIDEDILSTIIRRDLSLFRSNISFLNRHIELRMKELEARLMALWERSREGIAQEGITGLQTGDEAGDLMASLDILALEQRVHGTPKMVRERQKIYLQYFQGCKNVLAIGCGRGEFLQLLDREGIPARGTDNNPELVEYCQDHDLNVTGAEPLDYLRTVENDSLDGILLSRFVGHRSPAQLIRMLLYCRDKLLENGVLVIEAPNPFSLYAVASYTVEERGQYHPLHPETLRQVCITYGFRKPEIIFLNPLPPEEHLEEIEVATRGTLLGSQLQELFREVNENFNKINRLLFSHSDYALVTRSQSGD